MRLTRKLLTGCAVLALIAVAAAPASADPPRGVVPRPADAVGVGSDTVGYLLDQLSRNYDEANPAAATLLYSWDPVDPDTGKPGGPIETKATCASIARPDGSSAGIAALEANTTDPSSPSDFCIDYAGSSRAPRAGDPKCAAGGVCFIGLAVDAVTWAARDAASGGTDAPASLTVAQLTGIYRCTITNWSAVGGKKGAIKPFLPQPSSGLRADWLTAIGVTKPGPCVSDEGGTLQDNQGITAALDGPGAVVPYSAADYIAQVYHDAPCTKTSCTGSPPCKPAGSQNRFGCDEHGVLGLGEIDGDAPLQPWPAPAPPCATCAISATFPAAFLHDVFAVVRYAATATHIPAYLQPFFDPAKASPPGISCTSVGRNQDKRYGLQPPPWPPGSRRSGNLPGCGIPYH
jgi:ABC-type phosphate transport system substrate-binding protein